MNACETNVGLLKRLCEEGQFHDAFLEVNCMDLPVSKDLFYMLIDWTIKYRDLLAGRNVHRLIVKSGLEADIFLGNNLIRMFGLCGSLPLVNQAFSKLHQPNSFTWSVTIAAYANLGLLDKAIRLCDHVHLSSITAGDYVFTTLLKACGNTSALCRGKMVHDFAVRAGLESAVVVANALIDMYFRCGSGGDAQKVFDRVSNRDVVTWTAMLAGYVQLRDGAKTLQLFQQMRSLGIEPNRVTFTTILRACASMGALLDGKLLHTQIVEQGFDKALVVGNTLVDMYAKCCSLMDGLRVFECLTSKNIVSWTTIIEGYINNADGTEALSIFGQMLKGGLIEGGHSEEALQLFWSMQTGGLYPDSVSFISILKACPNVARIDKGRLIHSQIVEAGLEEDVKIGSALVDFYSKNRVSTDAHRVLDVLDSADAVMWTAMIAGYVEDQEYTLALSCFKDMQKRGVDPDEVTFLCVLSACAHMGLVDEGCHFFMLMRENYGLSPGFDHYDCIANLLGHAGYVTVAESILHTLPHGHNSTSWISLLGHCTSYGSTNVGRECFNSAPHPCSNEAATHVSV